MELILQRRQCLRGGWTGGEDQSWLLLLLHLQREDCTDSHLHTSDIHATSSEVLTHCGTEAGLHEDRIIQEHRGVGEGGRYVGEQAVAGCCIALRSA